MKEHKKIFYEEMYGTDNVSMPQERPGLMDILYHRFKRFELHREDAVAMLVTGGGSLLDVGCGGGDFIYKVYKKFQEIHGVDIASNRIKEAADLKEKKYRKAGIKFQTADIDQGLPFSDDYFDTVTCIATFQHIHDPYFVIREIRRVLKKDGTLFFEVPNIAWLPRRLTLLFGEFPKVSSASGWDGGTLHYFTLGSIKELVMSNGFRIQNISCSGILWSIRKHWPSVLSGNIILEAKKA